MKKIIFLILLIVCLEFLSCSNNLNTLIKNSISEIQLTYYYYEDEEIEISLISGKREEDYALNGVNTPLKNYCVVMINQTTESNIEKVSVNIDNVNYSIIPLLNPFNNNYVYDLEIELDNNSHISVYINNNENPYILNNVNKNFNYSYEDCLNISINEHKNTLKNLIKNNTFNGETYIRILKVKNFNAFVYQIIFIDLNQNTYQTLINPIKKEIYKI